MSKPVSGIKAWVASGAPWIWLNASAVSLSIVITFGLLFLIIARGMSHFWPAEVIEARYMTAPGAKPVTVIGELVDTETVPVAQIPGAAALVDPGQKLITRHLLKTGNRDATGRDFQWVLVPGLTDMVTPADLVVMERREWGNFYGRLLNVKARGEVVASGEAAWTEMQPRLSRALQLAAEIEHIEKTEIGRVNYSLEKLRRAERRLELRGEKSTAATADIEADRAALNKEYERLNRTRQALNDELARDSIVVQLMDGQTREIKLGQVVDAWQPNTLSLTGKIGFYFHKLWGFLWDGPREANTEGGIFPAIYGTVALVILMSILVTPVGVITAVYLREYAKQNWFTRLIRISVNNLAGVPSIVYGVFGLGFFVYFLGGNIDRLFFPEALPAPTFGSGGLLWASLTLALLTVPVVIVATEEGLARIPRNVREGSLALGATKFETLWRTVLPMASPGMMTGLILAIARASGETAPLMLVGVVKLAPSLPVDLSAPFVHLERKFMHLGFHIYDVGFQSPNIEAAQPLVYATAFALVLVIMTLNLAAIGIRNRLREKYRALDN
jgi:phosphate transport system permease protein